MKKLIFLLIMAMALAGFVSAQDIAHPPGVISIEETTLEATLAEYGAQQSFVTQPTVLVAIEAATSYQADMAVQYYNALAMLPQNSGAIPITDTGQFMANAAAEEAFYLRL